MFYDARKLNDNTWCFEENGVRFFLLTGESEALLIDTGMQVGKAREAALEITTLPLKLLNTHGDPDHIGSNFEFDEFYMNMREEENYRQHGGKGTILPVKTGDIIDLGNRPLEIIELPGHTPGSIAILDKNSRILFSGDSIQDAHVFMFGKQRNMSNFVASLENLKHWVDKFDLIYPSHGTIPLTPDFLDEMISGANAVLSGSLTGMPKNIFGNDIFIYKAGKTCFLCDK